MNLTPAALEKITTTATKIYRGRDHGCRCGCKGTYAERGSRPFTARLRDLAALKPEDITAIDDAGVYLNVSLVNNKAITAYFD